MKPDWARLRPGGRRARGGRLRGGRAVGRGPGVRRPSSPRSARAAGFGGYVPGGGDSGGGSGSSCGGGGGWLRRRRLRWLSRGGWAAADEHPPRGGTTGGSPRGGHHGGGPLRGGGIGIGWRPAIAGVVDGLPGLRFCEVIAESLSGGGRVPVALPRGVAELRGRGVAVVPHGVRLSLGGAEPLDPVRVTHLAACAAALDAPLVSEHVAFVRAGGREAGHLLPLPRSRDALDVLSAHVRQRAGRAGRAARAGADRGAVRLAGRRVHRGRVPHRAAGTHRRDAAARRRQRVRERA